MTTATLDPAELTPAPTAVPKRRLAAERPRFPLVLKLFLLTALVIVLVVGFAIGLTVKRANTIAHTTVDTSISSAARLFKEFEKQRLGRLELAAQIAVSDSNFVAYIQENLAPQGAAPPATAGAAPAQGGPDLVSILDQLTQRRDSFGSDLVILLDDQGKVVARTDQPAVTTARGEDFYEETPIVRKVVDDASIASAAGVLFTGNRLYHAAVVPLGVGANRGQIGYLINAYAIDDTFANRIAESTNAGVIFTAAHSGSLSRSSNAPSVGMQQMAGVDSIFKTGKAIPPSSLTVDRSAYVMTGEPLLAGNLPVGAAVFVRSLDRELLPFRQIEHTLFGAGGAALFLAFVFSWLVAKRITRPIEELAGVAQAVTAGDLSAKPPVDRSDEVGILGRSFAKMITALRDKAELEELYSQMASKTQGRDASAALWDPTSEEGTVLVTDLRGVSAADGDAAAVIAIVGRAMRLQETEVERQEGQVREIEGHRLVSVFPGERGIIHAIRAARAINEELTTQFTPKPLAVGVGIATGEIISGSVKLAEETGLAMVGNAPLLALLFAWHAPSGTAYISYESAQTAGTDVLASAAHEEVRLKWLAQPLPVASIPLATMTTGMMRSIGSSSMATMRIDGTEPEVGMSGVVAAADLEPGTLFANRYRIDQVLGRGGMGVVYRANDTQLDEIVAIKTLPGDVMQRSPENLERFKREIRLARKITHRNVLRTYDYGEADGVVFISMEYVRGYTLAELLGEAEDHRLPTRVAVSIARQISRGLHVAHEQGIIHRDIKPQNVLIDHKGEVKLMDFGIARMAESSEGMTQAGLIVGTPHYMSPEQVQGKQLDPRSDVYSMGVMLYELVTGARPFDSPSLTAVLAAHITEKPRPPIDVRPEIGREVNAILLRCLEKQPSARYADAGELLHDLDSVPTQSMSVAS